MTIVLAIIGFLAFGWFLNQCAPALDAHTKRKDAEYERMLANMSKRQRHDYFDNRRRSTPWGL